MAQQNITNSVGNPLKMYDQIVLVAQLDICIASVQERGLECSCVTLNS